MGQTDWGLPEAAVSWVGLKVLQDVFSPPILGIYHCFLLFYVAVSCRSGRVPAPLATSRCKMYDVRRSVHHRMLCALSTEIFYNQHEGGAKQFCSQKKRRGKQKIKNRQSNGSESRNDGLKSGVKPERT